MAVVTRYTAGYPQPTPAAGYGFQGASSHESAAYVRAAFFAISVTSGDSATSIYRLGRVPSNAIILPQSNLYVTALAGLTDVSVGLDNLFGTTDAKCLVSDVDMHTGGAYGLTSNVPNLTFAKTGIPNPAGSSSGTAVGYIGYQARAWALLGLTADPGSQLDVIATLGAAPSASGFMVGHLLYSIAGL